MAAPQENLMSPGYLADTERNTFPKQREHNLKKSINRPLLRHADLSTLQSDQRLRVMHLQQHWQELKERELAAQQHNRQLLLQFEKAQDTLTEMLTLTAAMKTIRVEYERYLDESTPRWQQQLKKTQAAQRKKMDEYLKSCSKMDDAVAANFPSDGSLFSQGVTTKPPLKPPTENSHYNQDGFPHLSSMQSSWQTHPPPRAPRHPYIPPSYLPQSFLPPSTFPHQFQLPHLASTPTAHPPLPGQHPAGWVPTQTHSPWAWTTGTSPVPEALWGQLCTERPLPEKGMSQVARGEVEMNRGASSSRDRGAGSRNLSQELDTKPVRLSSGPAESSDSSMESSQSRRERRKRRGKTGGLRRSSSDKERCSSQESSRSSSVIITAAARAAESSESDASSEKSKSTSRGQRSAGLYVKSPRAEKALKETQLSNEEGSGSNNEESRSTVEESRSEGAEKPSPDDQSESCREESGSQGEEHPGGPSIKIDHSGVDEREQEESSSSEGQDEEEEHEVELEAGAEEDDGEEQDSQEEGDEENTSSLKDEENDKGNKEEKEDSQGDEEQEGGDEDDEQEEMEDEESEEEKSDGVKDKDVAKREQSSASSQDEEMDEDDSEGGGDDMGDEEEESDEEQMRDTVEGAEDRDSEDSIVSPQKKCEQRLSIPEEGSDEEQSAAGASADHSDEFSDEDIEHLLAPQEQSQQKQLKDSRAEEKPTALSDVVEPFQMETTKATETIHLSDAEEFDDFYD